MATGRLGYSSAPIASDARPLNVQPRSTTWRNLRPAAVVVDPVAGILVPTIANHVSADKRLPRVLAKHPSTITDNLLSRASGITGAA
jgi:hypothetical protein